MRLREVADVASLEETTAELSQVAEICVTQVLEHWDKELRQRLGSPEASWQSWRWESSAVVS